MDRETLREEIRELVGHRCPGAGSYSENCLKYTSCSLCRTDAVLSLPTIAAALKALEEREVDNG